MATIEINTLVRKNKFGKTTYFVVLDNLHRIEINETTNGTFIVEFFELGIIWNTNLYSFTSSRHILDVISESMDKVADYYRHSNKYNVPEHIFVKDKKDAMAMANRLFQK
jgi:hypothetical protein